MKNLQRNLFLLLALALCGTCAYQWYLQAIQLNSIENRNQTIFKQSSDIQDLTNSVKRMDDEINQLDARLAELKQAAVSNDQWAMTERHEVARLKSDGDLMTDEIIQYKAAVDQLTGKLKDAYTGEKGLAAQRDELVKKLNESIKAENALTIKYNELVERFNTLQAGPAPAKP